MTTNRRQLSLIKGRHRYVFQFDEGHEAQLVGTLVALADDPESGLDWFDAAVLSYEMGKRLESECRPVGPENPRD